MKRICTYCLLIGFVLLAASAMAETGSKRGCTLQGSWMGIGDYKLLTTYSGQSDYSGTIIEELPGFDATLGLTDLSDAVTITSLRGVWKRTGGNTFAYTQVWYGLGATGNIVYIAKNSGNKTLTEDCNLMTIESTLEVFAPDVNPFEGTPLFGVPVNTIYLNRMRVDPPASL